MYGRFWPEKVGFCPVLFQKWPARNRCGARLCGVSAHFPTFFFNLCEEKSNKIYIIGEKKWAFGQRAIFSKNHGSARFPLPFLLQVWYTETATQLYIFVATRKYLGKRCFLSFLIHIVATEGCVAAMERYTFAGASLHRGAPFLCP